MVNSPMMYIFIFLLLVTGLFVACGKNKQRDAAGQRGMISLSDDFRKNKDNVWFRDEVMPESDAASFRVLDDYYVRDKDKVWYYKTYRISQDYFTTKRKKYVVVKDADASNFITLAEGYAKDKSRIWYCGEPFEVFDLPSVRVLNRRFIADQKTAYADMTPVPGSHGPSFKIIDTHYAKDNAGYYFLTSMAEEKTDISRISCDGPTFQIMDYPYAKDQNSVFYKGHKIPDAKPETFTPLGYGYAIDTRFVFYNRTKIPDADPSTFKPCTENATFNSTIAYARDKNRIYINEIPSNNIDKMTFRILNENYSKDKNGIYYQLRKIHAADAASFTVFPHYMGDADAEDKNHRYAEGKVVE